MSEQSPELLTSALANFVNQSTAILNSTTDLVNAQIPIIFEQLVLFEIVSSSIWLAVSSILLAVLATIAVKCWRDLDIQLVPLGGMTVLTLIVFGDSVYKLLLVTLAPNVFLLEYVRNLI